MDQNLAPTYFVVSDSPGRLTDGALRLFPDADILTAQHKRGEFEALSLGDRVRTYPSTCTTRSAIYQHVLGTCKSDVVVFVDDGVTAIESMTGWTPIKYGRPVVDRVVANLIEMAYAVGAPVFGLRAEPHGKSYRPFDPISFKEPVAGELMGFIGRSVPMEPGFTEYDGLYASAAAWDAGRPVLCDHRFRMVGIDRSPIGPLAAAQERLALQAKFRSWLTVNLAPDGSERVEPRKRKAKKKRRAAA